MESRTNSWTEEIKISSSDGPDMARREGKKLEEKKKRKKRGKTKFEEYSNRCFFLNICLFFIWEASQTHFSSPFLIFFHRELKKPHT